MRSEFESFFRSGPFAVVGASGDRTKFGNRVLRCYLEHGCEAIPINPKGGEVEGLPAYPDLGAVPEVPGAVSIITPPPVTASVVTQALSLGIRMLWMQPGAESEEGIAEAEGAGAVVIHGGACVLVELPRFAGMG